LTKCILIFKELEQCIDLLRIFEEKSIFLTQALLIKPSDEKISIPQQKILLDKKSNYFIIEKIETNRILNPKLDRQIRQQNMKKWLMPFGFLTGLAFSNMTNLTTFSFLGLNTFGDSILGGLLGMGSGYIGSFFASASINLNRNKEIRPILNANKQGQWLMLLENQNGYELPWNLLKESEPLDLIFIEN
tara:strand:+ start:1472 stop:2038 length:567 start_codon:yes stop_codon:yes gene_type:complete